MTSRVRSWLVISLVAIAAPSAFANLLTNGSFETGDFTGWTVVQGLQAVATGPFAGYPGAQDGSYYAVFGAEGTDGSISQSFSDTNGAQYVFSFWLSGIGDDPSDFNAYWNSDQVFSVSDPNTSGIWTEYSFTVTGTGSDTVFLAGRDDPNWIALDNVSVESAVPEPSSLLLLGAGLLTAGTLRRRKR